MQIKDVARKTGSGTASIGLDRLYVLCEGKSDKNKDDLIMELKVVHPSVLKGLLPAQNGLEFRSEAERIKVARKVHNPGDSKYHGSLRFEGRDFIVRERGPYKSSIEWAEVGQEDFGKYAKVCGQVLAQAHARLETQNHTEKAILAGLAKKKDFKAEVADFAVQQVAQTYEDYQVFQELMRNQAFGV